MDRTERKKPLEYGRSSYKETILNLFEIAKDYENGLRREIEATAEGLDSVEDKVD